MKSQNNKHKRWKNKFILVSFTQIWEIFCYKLEKMTLKEGIILEVMQCGLMKIMTIPEVFMLWQIDTVLMDCIIFNLKKNLVSSLLFVFLKSYHFLLSVKTKNLISQAYHYHSKLTFLYYVWILASIACQKLRGKDIKSQ